MLRWTVFVLLGCATAPPVAVEPRAVGEHVADAWVAARPPQRLRFDWGPGVLLFGLQRMAEVSPAKGDTYRDYIDRFHAHHVRPRVRRPDHCAPALTRPVPAVTRFLEDAPRNRFGAIDHLRSGRAIWVDSLVMYGLVASASGDDALRELGLAQPRIFAAALQDESVGLFRHSSRGPRVFWGRGNGWAAWALVDTLERRPSDLASRAAFERLAAAVVEHQRSDGWWTTVLDDPRTYREPSATLLLAYALAKGTRLGLLPGDHREAARRAYAAVVAELDGTRLRGISGPTVPGPRVVYATVIRVSDRDYGVGALLLASAELSRAT